MPPSATWGPLDISFQKKKLLLSGFGFLLSGFGLSILWCCFLLVLLCKWFLVVPRGSTRFLRFYYGFQLGVPIRSSKQGFQIVVQIRNSNYRFQLGYSKGFNQEFQLKFKIRVQRTDSKGFQLSVPVRGSNQRFQLEILVFSVLLRIYS